METTALRMRTTTTTFSRTFLLPLLLMIPLLSTFGGFTGVLGGGWQPVVGYGAYNADHLLDNSGVYQPDCAVPFGTSGSNVYLWTPDVLGITTTTQLNSITTGTPYYFQVSKRKKRDQRETRDLRRIV